ncbi:MAG: 16S rRNA (cytosine(967)-C(5))-methyltransferase [Desulfobulbaceae bacterium]|nr:MAG: 16S rRNA (cytosine(967)-C(5))-methyltransferase [Desulfobulbaceae bacterium]
MTSRSLAIHCLLEQERTGEPVDQILAMLLDRHPLPDERDRQLAMAMVYGVLRHRRELDALISHFSKKGVAKLKAIVLQALRIGLFQLLFMDRVPASAAVNETVKGLGRQPKWLKGFVNGVLRSAHRDQSGTEELLAALPEEERCNHPAWLISLWQQQFGATETRAICLANNSLPPLSLCLHAHCGSRDHYLSRLRQMGLAARPGRYGEQAILLDKWSGPIADLPGYAEGCFHVQDEAAQLIASLFADLPAGAYLDGCAGLGGKTLLLDQVLPAEATLTAVEPHKQRTTLLQENLQRCRCRSIDLQRTTLQEFAAACQRRYDGILLDAPCSGLGIIRRQPDIRWNRSAAELHRLAAKQLALLETAAPLVAENGVLVYVTCSLASVENEDVISAFLARQADFTVEAPSLVAPAAQLVTDKGFFRSLPSQGLDGFFAARLRKKRH